MDTSALTKSLPAVKRNVSILDKPLSKGKGEVRQADQQISRRQSTDAHARRISCLRRVLRQASLSAFAFLFSEMVQYSQKRVQGVDELEQKCVASVVFLSMRQAANQLIRCSRWLRRE